MRLIIVLFLVAGIMCAQTPTSKGYQVQEIKDGLYWVGDGDT
jgi:hypothetical protein